MLVFKFEFYNKFSEIRRPQKVASFIFYIFVSLFYDTFSVSRLCNADERVKSE
jgi:hypothetical protein